MLTIFTIFDLSYLIIQTKELDKFNFDLMIDEMSAVVNLLAVREEKSSMSVGDKTWMSVQNFMAIHPIGPKIVQPEPK